jgi:hypothetical protein
MHVVFQTAVSCGGNANLGTFENQEIFREFWTINFKKVVLVKYRGFWGPKQNMPDYF